VAELVVSEAERQGVFLSQLERKILYFSETGWALADITETAQKFEDECDPEHF
jgi:hypothetical protein